MSRRPVAGRATLQQVADSAGVSIATASRALTGRGQVAPTTAASVHRAASSLGYVFDDVPGRRLDRRLAIVVGSLAGLFVDQIVEGLAAVRHSEAAGCVIATTGDEPDVEHAQLRALLVDPQIAAVVVAGGRWTGESDSAALADLVGEYAAAGKPLVFCGRPAVTADRRDLVVDYDNVGGARAAMSYLISQGHRDVLFVRGPEGFSTSDARARGVEEACASFGIVINPDLIKVGARDRRTGYEAVRSARREGLHFTAVFGECDVIAVGAMSALHEAGVDVPRDVSVIGFDDMLLAEDLRVPLTTVHVPFREVGHTAARLALDPEQSDRLDSMVAGTHLVIRKSVQPLH